MIWLLLLGLRIVLTWYTLIRPLSYWSRLGVKQTRPWPFLGDSWRTLLRRISSCEFVERLYNMYPGSRYSGFYQFRSPTLIIKDPELIKQITVKDFDHFTDHRSFVDPEVEPLWGASLFNLKGQKWREMRSTLSASFTSSKMKSIFHLMNEAAENFVQFFSDKDMDVVEVEMKDTFTRFTNDVIATSAFGIKVDSLGEPQNDFYETGKKLTDFSSIMKNIKFFARFLFPRIFRIFKITFIDQEATVFFKNLIYKTVKTREEKGIVRPDMINVFLEARKGISHAENEAIETGFATVRESEVNEKYKKNPYLSNDDITSQALIFFFAGFDTVSTAMCFGSNELAMNKEVQNKLRVEIQQTYKENDGKLTYDALLKMKYMDMIVSEILRKWPPVVSIDRVVTKPYTITPVTADEKPVTLKVDDILWLPIQGIHRDPANYPNPEKFDPERFSDENKNSIKPYTYLPFGSGPRNCIGSRFALLEIKALLFNLLLNFEIVPTEKTEIPIRLNRKSFIHTSEGGFWFGLKRIKN